MATRILGNSDLRITPIGFGAWALGGPGWEFSWSAQCDRDSTASIHRALEPGVNWIDTAAVYGLGYSEEILAKALESWKGLRPYVITKCARCWEKSNRNSPPPASARNAKTACAGCEFP